MQVERQDRGLFVTLEGPEGSGKSTQVERVGARLRAKGIDCVVTREPGGTAAGERIRDLLLHAPDLSTTPAADALLFNAARAQLVADVIAPALAAGAVVLCDRYADSTIAYQGYGAGQPLELLRQVGLVATGGLVPDLTILLDLPVEAGLERKARADAENRFEAREDFAFHMRVREGFLELAAAEPGRWVVVDGRLPAREIEDAIFQLVVGRLPNTLRNVSESIESSDPGRAHARTNP